MRSFLRVLSIILLVSWMALIFYLSAQTAEVSSATSGQVIEIIAEKVYPEYQNLTETQKAQVIEDYQFIARKMAHGLLYTGLGFLAFLTFISYVKLHFSVRVLLAGLISVIYAASDEFHQNFVPGRSCELRDFLIDTAGVLIAILLCTAFVKVIAPLRRKTAYAGITKKALLNDNYHLNCELERVMCNCQNLRNEIEGYQKQTEQLKAELEQMQQDFNKKEPLEPLQDEILAQTEAIPQMQAVELAEKTKTASKPIQLPEDTAYAASVIGKAVVEVTKLCNKLTINEQDETRKELVNLSLGRTEVLKAQILKVLNLEISFEEKKNLIEKEKQDTYDYFDSIIAQIS